MKIYKITFKDYDYDQYDGFVVVAKTAKEAIGYLKEKYPPKDFEEVDWKSGYTIKEIKANNYKKINVILDSYNAG